MGLINMHMLALPTQGLLTGSLVPVGGVIAYAGNTVPAGWLLCDGREVNRADYPDLFTAISTLYGTGDGALTFNLPNLVNRFVEGGDAVGVVKNAGLPNITGGTPSFISGAGSGNPDGSINKNGAFTTTYNENVRTEQSSPTNKYGSVIFNASNSNPIYGASSTVQPPAVTMLYIIRAVDALNDSFTIIYPNGGSKSAPANVTINTQYIEAHPFPGYHVHCVAEIKVNGKWGEAGWIYNSAADGGYGVKASEYDGYVIVQTGGYALIAYSSNDGNPFGLGTSNYPTVNHSTLPCRIKVWKVGRMEADE